MGKTEAIIDTCFIQKLSSEGKKCENIKKVLDELDYLPVVHPYIAEHELALFSYSENLIKTGYIRKIEYKEFLSDEYDRRMYEDYFTQIYEDMRQLLAAKGGLKQIEKLNFTGSGSIYKSHKKGSSMGDVHMILMAAFMRLPIILTEDSDIELLRTIAKKRIKLGEFNLEIFNGVDLLKKIASSENTMLSKKELEAILLGMGEKKVRSEIKSIWNEHHGE